MPLKMSSAKWWPFSLGGGGGESKLAIIVSDNGLSPAPRQAIIRTNAGILSIGPLGTNFSEILIEIYIFSFKKMRLKMLSAKWWPFCLSLSVLSHHPWCILWSLPILHWGSHNSHSFLTGPYLWSLRTRQSISQHKCRQHLHSIDCDL